MFLRETFAFPTFVMSTAVISWLTAPALSDESRRQKEGDTGYLPIQSISYEFGSKAMRGYFVRKVLPCLLHDQRQERSQSTVADYGGSCPSYA